MSKLEERLTIINNRKPEKPTPEDLAAIEAAQAESPDEAVTLHEFIQSLPR